jgi:hypothetical protein
MLLFMTGCAGMYEERLVGNYYLTKMDYANEDLSLSYDLGNGSYVDVVSSTLFAVGYDDEYIIAKRHPLNGYGRNAINKRVTYYYIVPLKYKVHDWPDENRIGPLSEEEFLEKRKELKMSNTLTFTKTFKKLE